MDSPEQPESPSHRRLLSSAMVVSSMTLLSRVLGLLRDVTIARFFGVSAGTDAFFVAFRIPNFLRRLFAEGAFNQAFVPVLGEYKATSTADHVRQLLDRVAGALGSTLILVTILGVVGAPVLITVFAPGFDDPWQRGLAIEMLRLSFPYILFISLTAFAGSILNTWGRFAVPAFTPVILNLSLIAAALLLAPLFVEERRAVALAWGVLLAGILQLAFQIPFLARLNLLPRPRLVRRDPGVRKVLVLMAPALFGVSVSQINLLLDTVLASLLETGSVTWLYYSDRLIELPLGVFAIAISTVILPSLSGSHSRASEQEFSRTLDWALRLVLLIGVPAMLALIVISEPLLTTLFRYGDFGATDVHMAAVSLRAYALGLLAFMLIKVLAPGYFARQDTRTPVRIGIIAMVANMLLNLLLVWHLRHGGLALATALAAWLNAGLLLRGLLRDGVYQPGRQWPVMLLRFLTAGLVMAAVIHVLAGYLGAWFDGRVFARVGGLLLVVSTGVGVYFVALLALGLRMVHVRREG